LDVSLVVTAIAVVFSKGRVLVGLVFSAPLIAFFALWSFLLGGIEKIPTFIALITVGFLVIGLKPEEIAYALMFFRIPPKIAYAICIAMRLLRIAFTDLQNISAVLSIESRGFKKYAKLLKALTSVLVLRSFSIAESLYSRSFDLNKKIVLVRRPNLIDWLLLASSIAVFVYSLF
jgi:CBS domain containing-hemolysin-like protein